MEDLMSSLTGTFSEEYTLYSGCKPKHKITWTYNDEASFLEDVQKLHDELGNEFYLDGMWRIENGSLGMTISAKISISLTTYLKQLRGLEGVEDESEEE